MLLSLRTFTGSSSKDWERVTISQYKYCRAWLSGKNCVASPFPSTLVPNIPFIDTIFRRINSKLQSSPASPLESFAIYEPPVVPGNSGQSPVTMMMIVSLLARAARGSNNSSSQLPQQVTTNYYTSCACGGQQQYCAQCPPSAPNMSRRECKREYKHERREMKRNLRFERRALKAERRAARRGYSGGGCVGPVPVHAHHAPQQPTYGGGRHYGPQGCYRGNQGMGSYNDAGPSRGLAPQAEGQDARRASFDVRDLEREDSGSESDAPPAYEQGNWQRQPVSHRRSVEVLTPDKKTK